jgi:activator of Hsp90 ATPase-like protein
LGFGSVMNDVNTLVTVELNPRGDETELVLTHERLPTSAIVGGHTKGWGHILDHLAQAAAGAI